MIFKAKINDSLTLLLPQSIQSAQMIKKLIIQLEKGIFKI